MGKSKPQELRLGILITDESPPFFSHRLLVLLLSETSLGNSVPTGVGSKLLSHGPLFFFRSFLCKFPLISTISSGLNSY